MSQSWTKHDYAAVMLLFHIIFIFPIIFIFRLWKTRKVKAELEYAITGLVINILHLS